MAVTQTFPSSGFPLSPETDMTAQTANLAITGKINSIGTIALNNDDVATSSLLENFFLSPQSVVVFDPMDALAAAELASGGMFVTELNRATAGQWTITHAVSVAGAARKFAYAILG